MQKPPTISPITRKTIAALCVIVFIVVIVAIVLVEFLIIVSLEL